MGICIMCTKIESKDEEILEKTFFVVGQTMHNWISSSFEVIVYANYHVKACGVLNILAGIIAGSFRKILKIFLLLFVFSLYIYISHRTSFSISMNLKAL